MILACPACTHLLAESYYGSVIAQVCTTGCGGIWISQDVIQALEKTPRIIDRMLAATESVSPIKNNDPRICPNCHVQLEAWNVSDKHQVEIDICPQCQGIWLDQGEVATLALINRKEHPTRLRKQIEPIEKLSGLAVAGGMAQDMLAVAAYDPFLTVQVIDAGLQTADLAVDVAQMAVETLPCAMDAVANSAVAVADGVAALADGTEMVVIATEAAGAAMEVAGAAVEVAGAAAEIAGGAADAIGGLFEIFNLFG